MSNIRALVDAIKNIDEAYERSPWISGSEPEGKTHEESMRDDFGVPNHVKLDGDEPEGKEAVELWNEVGRIFNGGVKFTCYPETLEKLKQFKICRGQVKCTKNKKYSVKK